MPVGPCLDAAASRIAVLVKDHAIEDGYSEGTIPPAGMAPETIMIWDRGIRLTDQDAARALYAGEMRFRLCGKKLNGIWSLTRMPLKPCHKPENWLSKREFDEDSRSLSDMDVLVERPESVRSGRTLAEIARDPPPFVPARPGTRPGGRPAPNQLALFT